jgi:hypothetical protein
MIRRRAAGVLVTTMRLSCQGCTRGGQGGSRFSPGLDVQSCECEILSRTLIIVLNISRRSPLPIARSHQLQRTGLYVSSVALSMFLMLVFMTYNAWLIASVLSGKSLRFG